MPRIALYLAFASAVSVLFSIAASHILLGLALAALLASGVKLRVPPLWLPLALFCAATLVSMFLSPDAAGGLPQVRKMYVYTILLTSFSLVRDMTVIRRLMLAWGAGGAVVALRGLVQYASKVDEARSLGRGFYEFYTGERITGFMSHWMTFSGQGMFVLLLLVAFLLFAPPVRRQRWVWPLAAGVVALALLLGWTRSIWGATAVAGLYLAWSWKRWSIALAPVAIALLFFLSPGSVRTRVTSIVQPSRQLDSNEHRLICRRAGYQMIKAHPWFGVGPEQIKVQFERWVPADIPRPLPAGWYGHLHNVYVHYAAERGIPAMLALVWLLAKALFDFARALRRLPPGRGDRRFVLHGAIAVTLATAIAGFWELNLGDSEVLQMFLVVASCGYVAAEAEPALA
ncbi:MAG: O-antigen ligase family protein [Bryobacteraceae bacterium]